MESQAGRATEGHRLSTPGDLDLAGLARRLQDRALTAHVSVGTAESCTGGLVGHTLTGIAGSSDYYRGGVISYSNELKVRLLGVPAETIERHGAVSAQVAVAMAEGARGRLDCDYAVSVTGVAGPAGGTPDKPVGLTYVAAAGPSGHEVRRHRWAGDRAANKENSAAAAIELLLEMIGAEQQ
jgi:nicotinamide-nucleotide amidase